MSWFKKTFLIFALAGTLLPTFFVFADNFGIDQVAQRTNLIGAGKSVSKNAIPELIGQVIGIALSFVGVVFFLLILYAGFLWMTAFGNEEKVTSAKSIMEQATIGLVIVLSAYAISKFVFGSLAKTGGQAAPIPQANVKGCCANPTTGNQIENFESECVPNAQNSRTWKAGPCVVGCCYVTVAGSCTPEDMAEVECQLWGNRGTWRPGTCEASCP